MRQATRPSKHIMASAPSSPLTAVCQISGQDLSDQKLKKKKNSNLASGNKKMPKKRQLKKTYKNHDQATK